MQRLFQLILLVRASGQNLQSVTETMFLCFHIVTPQTGDTYQSAIFSLKFYFFINIIITYLQFAKPNILTRNVFVSSIFLLFLSYFLHVKMVEIIFDTFHYVCISAFIFLLR